MSYLRFNLDLAIKQPIPEELELKLPEILVAIGMLRNYAVEVQGGEVNVELSDQATYHICRHDEHKSCEQPKEIPKVAIIKKAVVL